MIMFLASLKDASCLELVALGNLPPKGGWLESIWSCMRCFSMNLKAPVFAFYTLKPNYLFPGVLSQVWNCASDKSSMFQGAGTFSLEPYFSSSLPLGLEFMRLKVEVSPPHPTCVCSTGGRALHSPEPDLL